MVYVFGLTSLVEGSPNDAFSSYHIFMWETDKEFSRQEILREFHMLSKDCGSDFYVFKSRPNKCRWHVLSFDIRTAREWDKIASFISLWTDYPQIWERTYDRFWTLRISKKGTIPEPAYADKVVLKDNRLSKSYWHINLYEKLGLVVPHWYRKYFYKGLKGLYFSHYNAHHL